MRKRKVALFSRLNILTAVIFIAGVILCVYLPSIWPTVKLRELKNWPDITRATLSNVGQNFLWNNQKACHRPLNDTHTKSIVIVVHTSRKNFENRQLIRSTLGSVGQVNGWSILGVLFMIGEGPPLTQNITQVMDWKQMDPLKYTEFQRQRSIIKRLEMEKSKFNDLIMADFRDHYRNMSIKANSGFKWLKEYCGEVDIVIRTDDDLVVNIFQLTRNLNSIFPSQSELIRKMGVFYCYARFGDAPVRNEDQFWYISEEEYPRDLYPPTCAGLGYLTTIRTIEMVTSVLDSFDKIMFVDDLFFMGVVVERFNEMLDDGRLKTITNSQGGSMEDWGRITHINMTERGVFWIRYLRDSINSLRKWFGQKGVTMDREGNIERIHLQRESQMDKMVFFLLPHGQRFQTDFLGVWNKIVILESLRADGNPKAIQFYREGI